MPKNYQILPLKVVICEKFITEISRIFYLAKLSPLKVMLKTHLCTIMHLTLTFRFTKAHVMTNMLSNKSTCDIGMVL